MAKKIQKRKTALLNNAEKKTLSEAKDKLIVEIPLVRGFRPIAVEPLAVVIPIDVENIRIAIRVGFICRAIFSTARLNETGLYFMRDLQSTSATHQVFFFEKHNANPPRKIYPVGLRNNSFGAVTVRALNLRLRERSRKVYPVGK